MLRTFHRKVERRSSIQFSFGTDASTVAPDDPLNRCQPDAGSLEFGCSVQPLEYTKQLFRVGHAKTSAVAADEVYGAPVPLVTAEFDASLRSLPRELTGIAEQVFEQDT